MRTLTSLVFIIAISLVSISSAALAQDPVDWTITQGKAAATVQAGSIVPVTVKAKIEDGWHIYSITQGAGGPMPTKITLPKEQPFTLDGQIKSTKPDVKFDENFGIDVETHENEATFTIPVRVEKTAKAGANDLMVNARYQVCNASICLPAKTDKLKLSLDVKSGSNSTKATTPTTKKTAPKKS